MGHSGGSMRGVSLAGFSELLSVFCFVDVRKSADSG